MMYCNLKEGQCDVQKNLTLTQLIKRGIFVIEPIRLRGSMEACSYVLIP